MSLLHSIHARGVIVALTVLAIMVLAPAAIHGQSAGASLWSPSVGPSRPGGIDQSSIEVGVRFSVDTPGSVNAIRFYKTTQTVGPHTVSLWSSAGALLGQGRTSDETASGWQQATLNSPVALTPGVTYVASYHTVGYVATQYYFNVALDPAWWARATTAAINYIRNSYDPAALVIYVQPVVGGPSGAMCGDGSNSPTSWVRASYNFAAIKTGLQSILRSDVVLGADPQVRTCSDYLDTTGHLDPTAAQAIGQAIAAFYSQPGH